ncbi:MAG: OmcA/MtrC family decaheme c-type cytochrome, partial [Lysobacterales bacterium]
GSRREIGLCILCHNPNQDIDPDTGNSFDMPLMTHKIHMGANLANGYNIIGYRQTDHDYSDVVYPAEVNECESCHTGGIPTANFPLVASPNPVPVCDATGLGTAELQWGDLDAFEIRLNTADGKLFAAKSGEGSQMTGKWVRDGTTFVLVDKATGDTLQTLDVNATGFGCVGNPPGASVGKAATDHTNWLDNPGRKSCGACHDWVNWETGEGHASGIPQENDDSCGNCHRPFGNEFDRSVRGAHMPLYKSAQLPNPIVEFISITNTGPGQRPTVTFSLDGKNGPIDPSSMNRMTFVISGPNEDWEYDRFNMDENPMSAVQSGGNWVYTFEERLPFDASGSFTISFEGRIEVDVDIGEAEPETERDYAENPMMAFAVTDSSAVARRKVVDDAKCEACHLNLSLHGGNRHDVTYCSTCHTPDRLDIATPAESVHMKWMIHKIHRGAELENGYEVIRSRGDFDFSHIEFTGDLRNCDACHVNGSQNLPTPDGALPTITLNAWWSPMQPQSAACLSCHDGDDAAVHAYSNTAMFGEACSVCHGEGKEAAVDKVHAH